MVITALYIILGLILLVVVLFLAYLVYVTYSESKHVVRIKNKLIPIVSALENGQEPNSELVRSLAADPETRNRLFDCLAAFDRLEAIPPEYRTQLAIAESDMVYWLCHPNELRQPPDEIEMMETVEIDLGAEAGRKRFYVFRYRTHPPHWAAGDGWMAGISGPYPLDESEIVTMPGSTFSDFEPFDARTPEEHVRIYCQRFFVSRSLKPDKP